MRVKGHVDGVNDRMIRGWARDRWFPKRRLLIDLFARGVYVGQTIAGFYRADLATAGADDGFHGFRMRLPPDIGAVGIEDIHARVSDRADAWLGRPDGTTHPPGWIREAPLDHLDRCFGPLLDHLAASPSAPCVAPSPGSAVDGLFDQAAVVPWPLSSFAWHIAHKFGHARAEEPTREEYDAFVVWYLSDYALAKAPDRLPLSADEIASWRAVSSTGEARAETLLHAGVLRGAWFEHAARAVWMEDCLVDPAAIKHARAGAMPWDRGRPFPLSRFMAGFRRRNAGLAGLPSARREDRELLYACIMIHAIRAPHHLAFLPSTWLRAMLDTTAGESPFTRALARAFPRRATLSAVDYARHVLGLGFDVAEQSWRPLSHGGHRSSQGTKAVGVGAYDVQIIGPFRKTLGLAQSCRRLASMISRLDHSFNFVDYDLGNASASGACPVPLGQPSAARVNILHLNLEEIPEAMAFMPDVFSSAYNIAFPYWELNAPSACHRLGLALVDEVWAASSFLDTVFRPHAGITTRIGLCIEPSEPETLRDEGRRLLATFGIGAEDFVFLAVSDALSWVQRKNVLGTVEAFLLAHPDAPKARLVVKTHNLGDRLSASQTAFWARVEALCASDPRIVLVNETFDARKQSALLQGADCFVSLHRAEGLGLDILEAMRLGIPVIATAHGGTMDACTAETSWLVDLDLIPVPAEDYAFVEPGHVWAAPRPDAARRAMLDVMRDAEGRASRLAAAREHVAAQFGVDVVAARIERRLSGLLQSEPRGARST